MAEELKRVASIKPAGLLYLKSVHNLDLFASQNDAKEGIALLKAERPDLIETFDG